MLLRLQVCSKLLFVVLQVFVSIASGSKLVLEAQGWSSGNVNPIVADDGSGVSTYVEQDSISMEPRPVFVLLGDSITQYSDNPYILGFSDLLRFDYTRKADIINRGLSGYTTAHMLQTGAFDHIMNDISRFETPSLFTIFLGTNDAILPPDYHSVPIKSYVRNMETMVQQIRTKYREASILIICPPPVDDSKLHDRNNHVTGQYADECMNLAAELKVPSVELFAHIQSLPDWKSCFVDGLHFSKRGHQEAYEVIKATIDIEFPKLRVSNIPMQYPQ